MQGCVQLKRRLFTLEHMPSASAAPCCRCPWSRSPAPCFDSRFPWARLTEWRWKKGPEEFSKQPARSLSCLLRCWCGREHPAWEPSLLLRSLPRHLPGALAIIETKKTSIRRQYLSFGFENRKWLGISNLDGETGPDSTITEHNYPSRVCEEPPAACGGPARKLTWVNGLEENRRWQEAEMPFSSKSTWKSCLER